MKLETVDQRMQRRYLFLQKSLGFYVANHFCPIAARGHKIPIKVKKSGQ